MKRQRSQVRVGVAQMAPVTGDVSANLDLVADHVQQAREQGVELLVFPELALSGYKLGSNFADTAMTGDGAGARALHMLSREIDLVVGLVEETEDVEFFNSAIYFSRGEVVHVHRKVCLPNYRQFDERRYFGAGSGVFAFPTRWGRMAMLICGDCWHLPLPYLAVHDGADTLIVLAASSRQGLSPTVSCQDAWERMNRSYALTLSTFVVFANRVGSEEGLDFWGGSHIVQPDGNLLARGPLDEPSLVLGDMDLTLLRQQRMILPFRRDDRLAFTLQLGHQIHHHKTDRRDGFMSQINTQPRTTPYDAPPAP